MEKLDSEIAIEVEDFSFAYRKNDGTYTEPVLQNVNWKVKEGSFALLVGPTGCGKTTLMRNLKNELAPTGKSEGSIKLFGTDLKDIDPAMSAQTIGYVSQHPDNQIVCDTVWHELAFGLENIGMPVPEMRRRIAEVAHFFGIENWLEQPTDSLSGGQKQLLILAGVLALRPRIILLDEPTSMLDPVAAKNFLHALFRVNRELGLTMVVVTHEQEIVAEYATEMFEFDNHHVKACSIDEYREEVHQRGLNVDYHAPGFTTPALPDDVAEVISIKDLYVRYKRELPYVLRGLDLHIKKGSIHALVGGNGSGKSTLLSTLGGVLKADRGKVKNKLFDHQALLPQNPKTLFVCDSVEEELKEWQAGCGYSDEDILRESKRFSIDHLMQQHPYDLSGGQQQLLACCKIMLTKPDFLMMDEPTKGLDNRFRFVMGDLMCQLAKEGVTILLVTHDLAFAARVSDTTSMLFDGQIACTQSTAEFFEENLFYRPTADLFFTTWERK